MIICHKNQKLQMIWFIKTGGYQAAGEGHVGSLERLESVENISAFPVVIIKVKNLLVWWRCFDSGELWKWSVFNYQTLMSKINDLQVTERISKKKNNPNGTKKEMGTKDILKKMIRNVIQIFYHKVFEFNRSMFSILIFSFSCYLIFNQK